MENIKLPLLEIKFLNQMKSLYDRVIMPKMLMKINMNTIGRRG